MESIFNKDKAKKYFEVAPGVWGMKEVFVNFYMIRNETDHNWVLVDAGLKWSAACIKRMASDLFGEKPPLAIILTHGHFDHIGAVSTMAEYWNVPVFAHKLEAPYLNGKSSYPPPDPSVGGGMMSALSFTYPRSPINISSRLQELHEGDVPALPGWKVIHTPGHSPGHISLYNDKEKILIAGDAFVTTKAESAVAVLSDKKQLSGPPKYFTIDWQQARTSVQKLSMLDAETVATGHGKPMYGSEVRKALHQLADHFETAIPAQGRYVNDPARADESGVTYLPAVLNSKREVWIQGLIVVASVAAIILFAKKKIKARSHRHNGIGKGSFNFEEQFSPVK